MCICMINQQNDAFLKTTVKISNLVVIGEINNGREGGRKQILIISFETSVHFDNLDLNFDNLVQNDCEY